MRTYVDELLLSLLLCPSGLILEYDIVVPSSFHTEVFGVEQRIPTSDVMFTLFLFLCGFLLLLY
jgi:hypothetical protein